ncbi:MULTISPECIES: hypothetical protein [Bacillus]|uniref:hypothetical protein n=1 Tax=Bacillus TaxID=1386 RepID=UPI0007AA7BAF|nr:MULTISPECIES: hypothetical protein [Bacillus amyloliquefaciens group]ASZ05921.1 hypothetical protein CJP14_19690 [Bacillus velezensis]KZE59875.1 hypothetical protein AV542_02200 [Bacillus amyloliquefaciens]MCB5337056.1 hypothetical protein [Bacillus amyloliquefaciens]MCC5595075.1 hypothetical protein [Bacillus velezensis]MCQ9150123.1 hypothetical protein [Bacillus amyloliquefaciens]
MDHYFIDHPKELKVYQSIINSLCHVDQTLPKQVFKQRKNYYLFEEFHWVLSEESWGMFKSLANEHHDEFILMAVIDSSEHINQFYEEFEYFNWIKIPLHITADEYLSLLTDYPKHSKSDCIMNIASRVVWASPTLKWAIYGERELEICILGIDHQSEGKELATWRSLDGVVLDWISVVFPNQTVPVEFEKTLTAHYK